MMYCGADVSTTTEPSFDVDINIIHFTGVGGASSYKTRLTLNIYGIFTHSISLLQLFFDDRLHGHRRRENF